MKRGRINRCLLIFRIVTVHPINVRRTFGESETHFPGLNMCFHKVDLCPQVRRTGFASYT